MMIADFSFEKFIHSMHWLPNHQWSELEILTLSMTALLLLVWLTKIQRSKKVRRKYHNQFLENTSAMGMRWGVHHKNIHIGNDSVKDQLAPVQKQQNIETKELEEKPHKKFRFQSHTNIYKQTSTNLEQQISRLMADNQEMQSERTNTTNTESLIDEMKAEHKKLHEIIKQLQNEITTYKQAKESFEQQVSELTADNEKLQYELAELANAESKIAEMTFELKKIEKGNLQDELISEPQILTKPVIEKSFSAITVINKKQHRTIKGVRQKLCKKCNEWKPESEFHKNASSKDNLAADCKKCKSTASKERRKHLKAAQN